MDSRFVSVHIFFSSFCRRRKKGEERISLVFVDPRSRSDRFARESQITRGFFTLDESSEFIPSLTLAIFLSFIFSTADFQNSTYSTWKKRLFLFPPSDLSKPLREVLIGGIPVGVRLAGRLYLNWRATMYDWDAWKCHGTCLTSGSTLQLQSSCEKEESSRVARFLCLRKNQIDPFARPIFSLV